MQPSAESARSHVRRVRLPPLLLAGLLVGVGAPALGWSAPAPPLRLCAEAHNMPFSDRRGEGFENQIATLVARRLGRPLQYVWLRPDVDLAAIQPGQSACDAVIAEPHPTPGMETTVPYYWSSYVLLTRADRHLDMASLRDPRLKNLRIGVEAIGRRGLFTPPAQELLEAGLGDRLIPFDISPTTQTTAAPAQSSRAALVQALARGQIDVAAVWGPAVGQLAQESSVPLRVSIITDGDAFSTRKDHFGLQTMQFQISMGVRRGDDALRRALDRVIEQNRPQIEAVLERFGVPLINPASFSGANLAHSGAGIVGGAARRPGA